MRNRRATQKLLEKLLREKLVRRKELAKLPFEKKIQILLHLQRIIPPLSILMFFFLLPANFFSITHSVAVMPFENVNKDTSLDWLSMGISETITNDLLAIKGLALVE